ncbi:MAG: hypothetical protein Q4E89_13620, partial [Eubacteriales bacterium]|nr:hypothetical protein [Eubacteriales bacterium]
KMKTSCWIQTGKYKYYVNHIGRLQTSRWIQTRNKYYYVNKNGRMLTSCWLTLNGKKYYLSSSGARVSGEQYINGRSYYFNANGVYNPDIRVLQPVDPNKPMVALTFDDGPSAYTNRLLTCLEKMTPRLPSLWLVPMCRFTQTQ